MKRLTLHRLASALLCLMLALSLTACGGKKKPAPAAGNSGVKETISDSRTDQTDQADPVKPSEPEAEVDQELVEECLDKLGFDLEYGGYPGAADYLGYWEKGDTSKLSDWMLENCLDLTAEMPVMLTIPSERVLGPGYGKLFCVIPRGENTSLAVNHITWQARGNGLHPEVDEVLYREECAQPVLVFVDPGEPDIEISLVTNEGAALTWTPQIDENEIPIVPIGDDGEALLMDFAIFGCTTGLDYGGDWDDGEPTGDDWWLPPTNEGLQNTHWVCGAWAIEFLADDSEPGYAGSACVYFQPQEYQEYELVRAGVWRMEDDCVRLKLTAPVIDGNVDAAFPILIAPSGEEMHFQRARTGEGMPFLPDGLDSIDLTLRYDI